MAKDAVAEFFVLGPLEVRARGRLVRLGGRKQRGLLALLLLDAGEVVPVARLVDALWGERPPPSATNSVHVYVSQLRKALGDGRLVTREPGYLLDIRAENLDARRFEHLLGQGRAARARGDPAAAKKLLDDALDLWRGPALSDLGEEDFAQRQIARLEELRLVAIEERVAAELELGRTTELVPALEELVRSNPLRERPREQLMLALYRSGRQADALETYRQGRRTLHAELGLEPGPPLKGLEQAILRHDPALGGSSSNGWTRAKPASRGRAGLIIAAGAALLLVAGIAAAAVELTRGGGGIAALPAGSLGAIDPRRGKITSFVSTPGFTPSALASGLGAVWVADTGGNSVARVDLSTHDVRQTIRVGSGPGGLTVGGGAVWVANGLDGTVSRIDATTNQVVQTIAVGNGPSGIAFGAGAVWVANSADGTVSRIDQVSGRVTRTLPAGVGATALAVGFRRVWVVSESTGSVAALDPTSGVVLDRIGVGVDPDAVSAGAGFVWVANRADGTISKIDSRTGAVTDTIQVGRNPDGIAAGAGGVWVANGGDGTLTRIDPSNDTARTVRTSNRPQGLAFAGDRVYVAVGSSGLEHRGGTLRVLAGAPDFIDPALAYFSASWSILTMTNDGLVAFRRVGGAQGAQLVPDLAGSLPTPTHGGTTYTFQLRPGIRYSNGKLVEPADFRRALERVFEVRPVSGGAQLYREIVGATRCAPGKTCGLSKGVITDDRARSVTFHLSAPDADFLTKLALPFAFAVPPGTPAHDVGTHPVPATGPYEIASYRPKRHWLRLVRNPRYRQWSVDAQPGGYPDAITWSSRLQFDASAQARAVARGTADIATYLAPPLSKQELDALALRYPSQLRTSLSEATFYFFLNTRLPPFDDVRVRRAVNYAFDRQAFAQLLGTAYAPTCQILPPNSPGYRRTCPYLPGGAASLDRARRLVRSSGTAGMSVTVWVPSPIAIQGRYMVSVLDSLGYRARLEAVRPVPDLRAYFEKILDRRVRAQTGYYGWIADFPSAGSFLREEFSCAASTGSPETEIDPNGWCDQSLDAQMRHAGAVQTHDPPAATLLWQRIERELLAQAVTLPTYNARVVDMVSRRVGNYQFHPQWGALLDRVWVR
ncbi:MAG: BTAD domain-containing putative transcriptional regulator [Gaiellaceae bacterium]